MSLTAKQPLPDRESSIEADDEFIDVKAPSALYMALEARAPWEFGAALASWPMMMMMGMWPRGDGHHVIVYPGLAAGDISTQPLRAFLGQLGYTVHGWYQGINRGPRDGVLESLRAQLVDVAQASGGKVSLVGWSLGGIYAREIAKLEPTLVRGVMTLGTPFAQNIRANNAWRVYQLLSGSQMKQPTRDMLLEMAPPVPTTSVYSRTDGVVAWRCSIQAPSKYNPATENIEVIASHVGLGVNPTAWYALADRLSQADGNWQKFDNAGLKRLFFWGARA